MKNSKKPLKRARIIIRNLSFKVDDKTIREIFSKYGEINEINLPKSNEKCKGFCFIQFARVNEAAKAINSMNGKNILERPVAIDWAVPKDTFVKHNKNTKTETEENEVKEENDEIVDDIKSESEDEEIKEEIEENDDDDDSDSDNETKPKVESDVKPIKKQIKDVNEHKTIFIRNIPFEAKDEDLKTTFLQFGSIEYARIVYHKDSDHSAGTGFVKFKSIDSANLCLNFPNDILMFDNKVYPMLAVSREECVKLKKTKDTTEVPFKKVKKCARNLYLLKEGLILSGTPAAEGVSSGDMKKRLMLEKGRNEYLKDLSKFVSTDRLIIHNIPMKWNNKEFREMIVREIHIKPNECRIQRSKECTPEFPDGVSLGYGFVSFSDHESALKCLRRLNNNPNIWGKNRRPIVSFSIESKKALDLKKKRLEKSKLNLQKDENQSKKDNKSNIKSKKKLRKRDMEDIADFTGMTVNPRNRSNIRKSSTINNQMISHKKQTRKEGKMKKKLNEVKMNRLKKQQNIKINKIVLDKSKKKKSDHMDSLDKIAEKHKKRLQGPASHGKSKKENLKYSKFVVY